MNKIYGIIEYFFDKIYLMKVSNRLKALPVLTQEEIDRVIRESK